MLTAAVAALCAVLMTVVHLPAVQRRVWERVAAGIAESGWRIDAESFAVRALPARLRAHGVTVTGADGKAVTVKDASRVVAVGGSITEIVYALKAQKRLVAVDTTSLHPPSALKTLPNVGYMRALSAEGVLSVDPSLILAIDGSGPPDVLDVLSKASIPLVTVPNEFSENGILDKIHFIAAVLGVPEKGEALAGDGTQVLEELLAVGDGRGGSGFERPIGDADSIEAFAEEPVPAAQEHFSEGRAVHRKAAPHPQAGQHQLIRLLPIEVAHLEILQDAEMSGLAGQPGESLEDAPAMAQQSAAAPIGVSELETAHTQLVAVAIRALLDVPLVLESGEQAKDVVLVEA